MPAVAGLHLPLGPLQAKARHASGHAGARGMLGDPRGEGVGRVEHGGHTGGAQIGGEPVRPAEAAAAHDHALDRCGLGEPGEREDGRGLAAGRDRARESTGLGRAAQDQHRAHHPARPAGHPALPIDHHHLERNLGPRHLLAQSAAPLRRRDRPAENQHSRRAPASGRRCWHRPCRRPAAPARHARRPAGPGPPGRARNARSAGPDAPAPAWRAWRSRRPG